MTKKDYILIAQAIHAAGWHVESDEATVKRVACQLADNLAFDNPEFKRARFLAACGVK